jgi:hypothetical protein
MTPELGCSVVQLIGRRSKQHRDDLYLNDHQLASDKEREMNKMKRSSNGNSQAAPADDLCCPRLAGVGIQHTKSKMSNLQVKAPMLGTCNEGVPLRDAVLYRVSIHVYVQQKLMRTFRSPFSVDRRYNTRE